MSLEILTVTPGAINPDRIGSLGALLPTVEIYGRTPSGAFAGNTLGLMLAEAFAIDYKGGTVNPSKDAGIGIYNMKVTTLDDILFPGTVAAARKKNSMALVPQDDIARQLQKAELAEDVRDLYQRDMSSPFGRTLREVAAKRGLNAAKEPDFYAWLDMPKDAYAVTITFDDGTVVLGYNKAHKSLIMGNAELRQHLNFGTYINAHEGGHIMGETSEPATDSLVMDALRAYWGRLGALREWIKREMSLTEGFWRYGGQRLEGYKTGAIPLALPPAGAGPGHN